MGHLGDILQRRQSWWTWSSEDGFKSGSVDDGSSANTQRDVGDGTSTVVQVVYVTQAQTFSGPIAGYVTQTADDTPTAAASTSAPITQASTSRQAQATTPSTSSISGSNRQSSSSARTEAFRSSQSINSSSASSTGRVASTTAGKQTSQTSSASLESSTSTSDAASTGMSGGAKAGIAFGIIMLFALIAGIAYFFIRKKKQQRREAAFRADSEKSAFTRTTSSRAPRLSLRPVTQFLPSIGDHKVAEMTSPTGVVLSNFPTPADSRPGSNASNNPSNPFGRAAETVEPPMSEKVATSAPVTVPAAALRPSIPPPAANPFADNQAHGRPVSQEQGTVSPIRPEFGDAAGAASTAAPAAAPAAALAPVPMAAMAVPAPASPTQTTGQQPNNVHRVQLNFEPTMDDELELRAGQVVRIVHEYDDGWALCAYMDRSRQGVAPRSCLSKLPLKPRPAGPPPQQGMQQGPRPSSPGYRNFSGPAMRPDGSRNPMFPAPLSPSLPNMNAHPRNGGADMVLPSGRPRSQSQSQLIVGQRSSPQMLPSAGFGASPPRKDHRRSASAGGLLNTHNSSNSGAVGMLGRKPAPGQAI